MTTDTTTKVDTYVAKDTYVKKDTYVAKDTYEGEDIPTKLDTYARKDTYVEDTSVEDTSVEDTFVKDTYVKDTFVGDQVTTDTQIEDSVGDQVTQDITSDTTGTRKCTDAMFEAYDNCWTTTCETPYNTCITGCSGNTTCEDECDAEATTCDNTCWETQVTADCRTAVDAMSTCLNACADCFTALDTISVKFTTANCKSQYEAVYGPLPAVPQCGIGKYCEDCDTDCPNPGICYAFSESTKDGFCTANCSTSATVCGTATGMTCVDNTWDTEAPIDPAKVCEYVNPNCTFGKVCALQDLFTSTCGASFLKSDFEFICSKMCYQDATHLDTCQANTVCSNTSGITMTCEVVNFQSGDKCACHPQ
jgi:hypothetical protein